MKRFRVLWIFVLAAVTAVFVLYQGVQALSAQDGGPQFTVDEGDAGDQRPGRPRGADPGNYRPGRRGRRRDRQHPGGKAV